MGSKLTFFVIILLFVCCDSFGDNENIQLKKSSFKNKSSIIVSFGGHYQFHLKGTTNEDPNIPDQYETIIESPAVGTFFDNSGNYRISLEFKKNLKLQRAFCLGFEYDNVELDNKENGTELFFGEKLSIKSFVPYYCYGGYINDKFIFGKFGIPFKIYQGKADINGFVVKNNYKKSIGIRFGGGSNFQVSKDIGFTIGIDLDLCMVKRKDVTFYINNQQVSKLIATGDDLQDTQISFYMLFSYQLNLEKNRRK